MFSARWTSSTHTTHLNVSTNNKIKLNLLHAIKARSITTKIIAANKQITDATVTVLWMSKLKFHTETMITSKTHMPSNDSIASSATDQSSLCYNGCLGENQPSIPKQLNEQSKERMKLQFFKAMVRQTLHRINNKNNNLQPSTGQPKCIEQQESSWEDNQMFTFQSPMTEWFEVRFSQLKLIQNKVINWLKTHDQNLNSTIQGNQSNHLQVSQPNATEVQGIINLGISRHDINCE